MLKKIASFILVFCMVIVLFSPHNIYAQSKESSLSSDTVITEDNIYEVLNFFNIDSSNLIKDDLVDGTNQEITIGDFKKMLKQLERIPTESTHTANIENRDFLKPHSNINTRNFASGTNTVMLYSTFNQSSYSIYYSVAGHYVQGSSKWHSAGAATVSASNPIGFTNVITNQNLNTSVINNGDTIRLHGSFTVRHYILFGWAKIYMSSTNITTNITWNAANHIP